MRYIYKIAITFGILLLGIIMIAYIDSIANFLYPNVPISQPYQPEKLGVVYPRVEIIKLIVCILGGLVALWGLFLNMQRTNTLIEQFQMAKQKNIVDEINKDTENLNNNSIAIRITAINSLYKTACENEMYSDQIFLLFCTHLKSGSDYPDYEKWDTRSRDEKKKFKAPESTQLIVNYLFPSNPSENFVWKDKNIDLSEAVLIKVNFENKNLNKVKLINAYLQLANFKKAKLIGAELWGVRSQGANFFQASLQGAKLYDAILVRADLAETHLEAAVFERAKLYGAVLSKANLQGANFCDAKIQGIKVENHINLQGTEGFYYTKDEWSLITTEIKEECKDIANFISEYIPEFLDKSKVEKSNTDKLTNENFVAIMNTVKNNCEIVDIINNIEKRLKDRVNK